MARFSDETYTYIIAGVAIAVVGFVLHVTGVLRPVESFVVRGFAPVQTFFYQQGVNISEGFGLVTSIRAVAEENQQLGDRVKELEVANAELKESAVENERLKEQLGFIEKTGFESVPSTVIGSDPNDFLRSLLINRGSDDGIEEGKAVLDSKGVLIGKVFEAEKKTATVLLITDSNSSVVGIAQESRATGAVVGELGLAVKMTSIAQEDPAQEGERVVTAGLEDNIPKGLAIGTLQAVEGKDNELFKEAKIEPFGDFKNIEMVFVLK